MSEHTTENVLEQELDKHFALPEIRRVGASQPFAWLRLGWRDMRNNLVESLAYGVIIAVGGWVIFAYTASRPHLYTTAISGFFLVAPLLAAGLYEISRRQERGMSTSFGESLQGWRRSGGDVAQFGVELVIMVIFWERISAILFALFYGGEAPDPANYIYEVFLSGDYWQFVVAYFAIGAIFATVVFAASAIAIPMLLDRDADIYTSMATSFIAVRRNIPAMALWALLIVVLTAIGFATQLVGLIVIFPVLGHAAWHAYRELTQWQAEPPPKHAA